VTSLKEQTWLACQEKTCCHLPLVVPTGRDVWRIARALDTPPWSFLRYFPTAEPRGDAFAIDQTDRRYRLVLAKRETARRKVKPCIFLMRSRHGHHRCGLGDLRPASCKSFPSDLFGGVLCVRNDGGCTCRVWSLLDVDQADERALVERREVEADEYRAVVADWNDQVATAPPEARIDFVSYCVYLLEVYDRIAAP
jgi:Fe-S-cluster containining protein